MIPVKDENGIRMDDMGRNPYTNAIVMSPNKRFNDYLVAKNNAERVKKLEAQVEMLTKLVMSINNT
jgi:hypothetical protein